MFKFTGGGGGGGGCGGGAQSGEWTIHRKIIKQKEQRGLGRKTREEIGKGNQDSNDSPEIPDIPRLSSQGQSTLQGRTS